MKILHTADVHLGRPFSGLGSRGKQLRAAQLGTLRRIVDIAASEKVDCVVIAGDLFDSNEVSGTPGSKGSSPVRRNRPRASIRSRRHPRFAR